MISRRALLLAGLPSLGGLVGGITGARIAAGCRREGSSRPNAARGEATEPSPAVEVARAPDESDASAEDASRDAGDERAVTLLEWTLPSPIERAVVMVPRGRATVAGAPESPDQPDQRYPVVIALHGRGEALKGPALGAMGWPRDYALERAFTRLMSPPLLEDDFEGLVETPHLAGLNRALAGHPFGKLVVACPYVPDLNLSSAEDVDAYAHALVADLLPRVRQETPALASAGATGIDGVSLGGIVALRAGLANPETFGAVGALQPAIRDNGAAAAELTELAKSACARRPRMKLRLTTSERDGFRRAVTRTSDAWRAAGIVHEFGVLPGPHDYVFNRGPGAIELLFWHDRVLVRA